MIAREMKKCPKIKITKTQLLELFHEVIQLYTEAKIIDLSLCDLPINEAFDDYNTNARSALLFMMMDFYILLGKDEFKKILCDEIKDRFSFIEDYDDIGEDGYAYVYNMSNLLEEFSYTVADNMCYLYNQPELEVDNLIDWFEFQISRDIFESHFILVGEEEL